MRKPLLITIFTLTCGLAFGQTEKEKQAYAEQAAKVQTDVWGSPAAEFKVTAIPANLSKESAVVLARSFSLSRASSGKLKFGRTLGITTRTTKFSIYHERVKINDKTALESFSTLQYQKKLDQTTSQLFAKFVNVNNTFIGAKVIKPAGKEVVVNTSEEVLIKNESKDQKGKLAIPDLQVGDILDYYICKQDVADKDEGNSYKDNDNLFFMVDEYPVLYYSIDFQFNKKIKYKTIYANGAPQFLESRNNEGDILLSLKQTNMPKYQSQMWSSPFRQYPYIEIGSAYDDWVDKVIEKNNFTGKTAMLQAQKLTFEQGFNEQTFYFAEMVSHAKDHFGGKKGLRAAAPDSIAKVLYNTAKYDIFLQYRPENLPEFSDLKYRSFASKVLVPMFCYALTDMEIDHDIMLVASRNSNSLDNVFGSTDFDALIRINGSKPTYMFFGDVFTQYNEIPSRFQGEKVIVLHPKRKSSSRYEFTESETTLPVIPAKENYIDETLNVSVDAKDMKKLKVDRTVTEAGVMRHDDQATLLTNSDIDAAVMTAPGVDKKGEGLDKRFKGMQNWKKFTAQVNELMAKENQDREKNFKAEIKAKFDQEPDKVTDYKIINPGVDFSSPVFKFSETFELNNLVKKAGNNYIIDAGKLTGGFLKLEEKDKVRNKDIYMPSARSFKYSIVINIPKGYTAKGMEEMTANKSNKTGSFSSSASVSGDKLTINIGRVYAKNFEKVSDWPQLVDLINTASEFDSKKILLEKN